MIVRRLGDEWILIEQAEHARHAAAIAEAWSRGRFGPLPASLVTAVRLHDIGWVEWDREPALDTASGGPANFTSVRDDRHSAFYGRGIRSVAGVDALASYLVSLHASGIYSGRYGWRGLEPIAWESIGPSGRRFLSEQREYRRELAAGPLAGDPAGLEFEATWSSYMLLQVFDYLSLVCCMGLEPRGCEPVPLGDGWGRLDVRRASEWGVALDPFPFEEQTLELRVACRPVPARRFEDDADLRRTLAAAPARALITRFQGIEAQ
jgi:Protein of unknown function (DUF3891)